MRNFAILDIDNTTVSHAYIPGSDDVTTAFNIALLKELMTKGITDIYVATSYQIQSIPGRKPKPGELHIQPNTRHAVITMLQKLGFNVLGVCTLASPLHEFPDSQLGILPKDLQQYFKQHPPDTLMKFGDYFRTTVEPQEEAMLNWPDKDNDFRDSENFLNACQNEREKFEELWDQEWLNSAATQKDREHYDHLLTGKQLMLLNIILHALANTPSETPVSLTFYDDSDHVAQHVTKLLENYSEFFNNPRLTFNFIQTCIFRSAVINTKPMFLSQFYYCYVMADHLLEYNINEKSYNTRLSSVFQHELKLIKKILPDYMTYINFFMKQNQAIMQAFHNLYDAEHERKRCGQHFGAVACKTVWQLFQHTANCGLSNGPLRKVGLFKRNTGARSLRILRDALNTEFSAEKLTTIIGILQISQTGEIDRACCLDHARLQTFKLLIEDMQYILSSQATHHARTYLRH